MVWGTQLRHVQYRVIMVWGTQLRLVQYRVILIWGTQLRHVQYRVIGVCAGKRTKTRGEFHKTWREPKEKERKFIER
jgi:hypothetical protein